ncbi:MAG: ATPase [Spirochaetae bacterium HGW-Spirochaetae-2]|nr:MAG: ATPase [Spirochaetae bacterium HGW-Spirochaetae-2]
MELKIKKRDMYLSQLISYRDTPLIKVVTGIRRCGKSTLLELWKQELLRSGVPAKNIIHINFESMQFDAIKDYRSLYTLVEKQLQPTRTYLMLDEIQQVKDWQKAVNALTVDMDIDIYLTGSNDYLLSSELSTLITGRYVEIQMFPLSFKEFLDFQELDRDLSLQEKFDSYVKYGSMPAVSSLPLDGQVITNFLQGIYNTVIMKDVIQRNVVKDAMLLESVLRYLMQNIGTIFSTKKIGENCISGSRRTSQEVVDSYLTMFKQAFVIYQANQFDIKKNHVNPNLSKYFTVDTGIWHAVLGYHTLKKESLIENIVYLELLRRNFEVFVGKIEAREITFIANRHDLQMHVQVVSSLADDSDLEEKATTLRMVNGTSKKLILTLDQGAMPTLEGIEVKNVLDFLLE